MTLNELSIKNDTSYAICEMLAKRKRHRNEPMRVSRFAGKVREYMDKLNLGAFDMKDLYATIADLQSLDWVKPINNKKTGRPIAIEFTKPISSFESAMKGLEPQPKEVIPVKPVKQEVLAKGLPTRYVFVMRGGKITMEIKGDVDELMKELKEII